MTKSFKVIFQALRGRKLDIKSFKFRAGNQQMCLIFVLVDTLYCIASRGDLHEDIYADHANRNTAT